MSITYNNIFSEYDIPKVGFKFKGDAKATVCDTVGKEEITSEVRTVSKKKRNMPWKRRTKETGSGTAKLSLHIPLNIYAKMYNADQAGYKDDVMVYGSFCLHEQFAITVLVEDEDGNQKLQALPCCTMTSGVSKSVEANGEEVAMVEIEVAYDPDSDGVGLYEYVLGDPSDSGYVGATFVTNWLEGFATSMVKTAVSGS